MAWIETLELLTFAQPCLLKGEARFKWWFDVD